MTTLYRPFYVEQYSFNYDNDKRYVVRCQNGNRMANSHDVGIANQIAGELNGVLEKYHNMSRDIVVVG